MKSIRTTLVSAIFRQFGICFGLFDISIQICDKDNCVKISDPCLRYIDYEITLHLQMEHDLTMTTHTIPYYDLKNIVVVKKKVL